MFTAWQTNFLGIQDITKGAWDWIVQTFTAGMNWIAETFQPYLTELAKFWADHGEQIMAIVKFLWETIQIIFTEYFEWMKMYIGTAWDIISGIFMVAFELIK